MSQKLIHKSWKSTFPFLFFPFFFFSFTFNWTSGFSDCELLGQTCLNYSHIRTRHWTLWRNISTDTQKIGKDSEPGEGQRGECPGEDKIAA